MINKDSNIDEVLKAVKKNGRLLKNASDTFKDDDFVVMKAIKQNGSALQFASHRLKKNRNFILLAARSNPLHDPLLINYL